MARVRICALFHLHSSSEQDATELRASLPTLVSQAGQPGTREESAGVGPCAKSTKPGEGPKAESEPDVPSRSGRCDRPAGRCRGRAGLGGRGVGGGFRRSWPPSAVQADCPAGLNPSEEGVVLNVRSELTTGSNPASFNQWAKLGHSAESGVHGLLQQTGEVSGADLGDEVRVEEADVEVEVGHELRLWAGPTAQRDEHAQRSGGPEGPGGGVEGPSASHSGHGATAKEPDGEVARAQRLGLVS